MDAGVSFVDTAGVYSNGESEVIVGKALAGGRRDDVVLATKVRMPMGEEPNRRGNSRRWIIGEAEQSLRRLGTDWIDLYQGCLLPASGWPTALTCRCPPTSASWRPPSTSRNCPPKRG